MDDLQMDPQMEEMLALGWRILSEGPQQVLVCRTADGEIRYASLLHMEEGDHSEEDKLLQELGEKPLTHILALLQNESVDLPSSYFQKALLSQSPESKNALVLLQTGAGLLSLPLYQFLPET